MNRDDLLKRCVDRRVAHETSVVAVSHLFYVYLLSALKKGQQVEVPNFGTFGTHMVGVKRQRRMPFFAVEQDLADKVNERYRNLKTLLVGKYELMPEEGEVEYTGKEQKYDPLIDTLGKEIVLDTERDVSADDFLGELSRGPVSTPKPEIKPPAPIEPPPPETVGFEPAPQEETIRFEPEREETIEPPLREEMPREEAASPRLKERKLMPKPNFNLSGEGEDDTQPVGMTPDQSSAPPPTLRELSSSEGPSAWLQIAIALVILGAITFALNHFGVLNLWGKKATVQVDDSLPPIVQPAPTTEESTLEGTHSASEPAEQGKEPTPTPSVAEETKPVSPPVTERKEEPKAVVTPPSARPEPTPRKEVATTPPGGQGNFTIQVSSWTSQADADRAVRRLTDAGFEAYVAVGNVKGRTWYRVRVGRYTSQADAQAVTTRLRGISEGVWVTKVD
ncbi:MAG: SPOR domain-containing protein [Bacteroidetes bacterium]|nr:SPOR domain-containing protein [Bacteroidota bacterium]MCW5894058.1 SPOR domain-containing protein [Bacteroidota bacterium]